MRAIAGIFQLVCLSARLAWDAFCGNPADCPKGLREEWHGAALIPPPSVCRALVKGPASFLSKIFPRAFLGCPRLSQDLQDFGCAVSEFGKRFDGCSGMRCKPLRKAFLSANGAVRKRGSPRGQTEKRCGDPVGLYFFCGNHDMEIVPSPFQCFTIQNSPCCTGINAPL